MLEDPRLVGSRGGLVWPSGVGKMERWRGWGTGETPRGWAPRGWAYRGLASGGWGGGKEPKGWALGDGP